MVDSSSHLLCLYPQRFQLHDICVSVCVCDALNPIDLQISCYQGQIVRQGKMYGPFLEVDPNSFHPHCRARFLLIVVSKCHATVSNKAKSSYLVCKWPKKKKKNTWMYAHKSSIKGTPLWAEVEKRFV